MATVIDLRLRSPERIPCNSEKSCRSLQSMMTASNLCCASFLLAWVESGQCSTSISNSPRTLRRRRTVRSSEQTTRDCRFITLTRNSTKKVTPPQVTTVTGRNRRKSIRHGAAFSGRNPPPEPRAAGARSWSALFESSVILLACPRRIPCATSLWLLLSS